MKKILHLTLKKEFFDMIASGEKKEEYRDLKSFWSIRFTGYSLAHGEKAKKNFKHFDIVSANNGYQKNCPNIQWKHEGIRIGEGREDWGAIPGKQYFILQIGEIVKK